MIEVEAILNSRPLTPMSSDPNDLNALTPGHFLIGEPPTSIVEPHVRQVKEGLLSHWKQVVQLKSQFWHRWSNEYLSQLQVRNKWKQQADNIKPGTMVIIKEDNLPPTSWKLGRITNTIKGDDGKIRVVDVKTATGVYRRAVHKLAPLPVEEDDIPDHDQASSSEEEVSSHSTECQNKIDSKMTTLYATSEHQKIKKRVTFNPITFLNLFLVFCTAHQVSAQMKASPFKSPPGIYFENLGNTHLVSNEWNLIVYYNTSFLWREIQTIKDNINHLAAMCEYHPEKEECTTLVSQFRIAIDDIADTNKLILEQRETKRIKRGAINFVGNVAHALFGVLDSEYADEMASTIANLHNDDQKLLALIKNQTSIIDSTVNLVQRSELNNNKRFIEMQAFINKTMTYIKKADRTNRELRAKTTINSLSIQLLIIIQNYQKVHSSILNVITNSQQGKIHPMLLTPSQLEQQISIIRINIPTFLRLPADSEDMLKFYHLMTVESRVSAKYQQIIFSIRVPLYSQEQFELLRVVPVPFEDNSTITVIQSVAEYLIINLHRDQYYPITKSDLKECVTYQDEFICKQHRPLYNKESNVSTCEVSILNHWPWSKRCQTKLVMETTHWVQLLQPNQWVYCLFKRTTLTVVHNDTSTSYALQGTGIIELQPGCSIKDSGMTITGHNIYTSKMKKSIIPSKLISEFIDEKPPEEIKYQHFIENNMVNHIRKLQDDIKVLRENENLTADTYTHHNHHYGVQYFTLTFVVVVVIIWCWRRNRRADPEPEPSASDERPAFNFSIEQPDVLNVGENVNP